MNEHEAAAVGYCADHFPPDTSTRVIFDGLDTAAYEAAYWEMARYADSLFNQLEADRNAFKPTPESPCPPPVNLDSLRKAVDVQIRKRLIPCKDSVKTVIKTIVDDAKVKHLQFKIDEKDAIISARDKRITELETKAASLKKWVWWFWGLVVVIAGYVVLKLRFKLLI